MSKTVVTKLVSGPHSEKVLVDCANCYTRFHFTVPIEESRGVVECNVCGAKTSWQEVDGKEDKQ